MKRNARLTAAVAAAAATLAAGGVQAQEANAWEIARVMGPMAPASWTMQIRPDDGATARAALSREQVVAELQRSLAEGTYHAGNDGSTPYAVLERRAQADRREAERIAKAYRDEADRIARINAQREAAAAPQPAETAAVPSATADTASTAEPATPSTAAPVETVTATPVPSDGTTSQPMPSDGGSPQPQPDVRPNSELATGRSESETSIVPPVGDTPRTDRGDPAATGAPATMPSATEPSTTTPSTTEPSVTEPVTEPSTSAPNMREPAQPSAVPPRSDNAPAVQTEPGTEPATEPPTSSR